MFTRATTDVFFVAFLMPNVLRQLVAEGAAQNGVMPVLAEVRQREGDARARQFFRALRGLSLVLLFALSALGIAFAPQLTGLFAGGYRDYGEQFERTVALTRWVFPYILFMGTAALGMAALNTHRRFVASSFAPALLNVSFIVCALALPSVFGSWGLDPMYALAVGVLVGGVLQVAAQWPSLKAIGYLQPPTWNLLADPNVREVIRRMAPVLLGFAIYYADVVVARHLLSDMGVGAQSYFAFALRLCDFPQGIFVMALQAATLPSLSALAARGDRAQLVEVFTHGLRLAWFVAVPATALMVTLAHPIVVTVFERGHFDANSSLETARALTAQAAGIWAVASVRQLLIVFYALGDTRTPVVVSAIDFLVFLVAAWLLRDPLGHAGISWAVTLSSGAQMGLLAWLARRRLQHPVALPVLLSALARIGLATLVATGSAWGVLRWLQRGSELPPVVPTLAACFAFAIVYIGLSWLLRSAELQALLEPLRRRSAKQ